MKSTKQATYALAGKLLPGKVLEGLKALGFKRKQVISAFAAYHLETNFFDHAENYLSKENKFRLTREELYAIWGYTTRFFYLELNTLLRSEGLTEKTMPISRLIISGLKKLPAYNGPVWREIQLSGYFLEEYLAARKAGITISCWSFVSCADSYHAANRNKTGKNVVEYYTNIKAHDISEIADGILFRGYSPMELLAFPPKRFWVEEVVKEDNVHYISMSEITF